MQVFGLPEALCQRESDECAFPIGEPGDKGFHYCCKKKEHKGEYCDEHKKVFKRKLGETVKVEQPVIGWKRNGKKAERKKPMAYDPKNLGI